MSYRQQLRRDLRAHAVDQAEALVTSRWDRRRLTGATMHRLDADGRRTGDVIDLDATQAAALLDGAAGDEQPPAGRP